MIDNSRPFSFDLSSMHLGDVLMALPAMREGDSVAARPVHRVPGAPVRWVDKSSDGIYAVSYRGQKQQTEAWLDATGRDPVRHKLMPPVMKDILLIAPDVASEGKRWHGWKELWSTLPSAVWIGAGATRKVWMELLNRAYTVICPDTGTAHMADALGAHRVIALHGHSENWPRCAPFWGRNHCVVRNSMEEITVGDILEAVNG